MRPCRGSGPTGPNSIKDLGEVGAGMVVDEHRYLEGGGQVHYRKEAVAIVGAVLDLDAVEADILPEISHSV